MKNVPLIIAGLTATALTLSSCHDELAQPQSHTGPTDGACAAILAEAQAVGDDLSGGTELYQRHLVACHTNPPPAPATTAPPAPPPSTVERPPPATDLASPVTVDPFDLI